MSSSRRIHLSWTGEGLAFRGGAPGGPEVTLDGDREAGPSPTEALLLSLAACMGIDIRMILEKSRVKVSGLEVDLQGERAEEAPRRFRRIRGVFTVAGPEAEDDGRLERALALSEDRYCSVLHSLRRDMDLDLTIRRG